MAKRSKPRCGSLQFWPRRRSKRAYPRLRTWPDGTGLLGFAGYKVGMTQVQLKDSRANSITKGQQLVWPVTILECPPLRLYAVRGYQRDAYGKHAACDVLLVSPDKFLSRKVSAPAQKKEAVGTLDAFAKDLSSYSDIRVLVSTQPHKTGIGKKTPELFEMALGGSVSEQFAFVQAHLTKEIRVSDVLSSGKVVDVHAVTTGKGFQGSVKRFGVSLKAHKSEKKRRATGNLGSWHPARVLFSVGLPGGLGYFSRTEYNKEIVKISDNASEVALAGGFDHYGVVRSDYVLVKGSIPGPVKRLIRLSLPRRPKNAGGVQVASLLLRGTRA